MQDGAQSHACCHHGLIVTNFCTGVGVHDIITSANFYDCRFWGLSVVGGQLLGFSIDSRCRPYNTLALPRECVIFLFVPCGVLSWLHVSVLLHVNTQYRIVSYRISLFFPNLRFVRLFVSSMSGFPQTNPHWLHIFPMVSSQQHFSSFNES